MVGFRTALINVVANPIPIHIQLRRGTASQWTLANPVLAAGEMGVELDTDKFKFGDGTTPWNGLSYGTAASPDVHEILAVDSLPAFKAATSNGKRADSANLAHLQKVIGLVLEDVSPGFKGAIAQDGDSVINSLWTWTRGDVIFLNGMNLSTIAPGTGFIQRIGTATAADSVVVEIGESILI